MGDIPWRRLSATIWITLFGALAALRPSTTYAADTDIVINEIMYHPDSDCELEEFIEFYNRSATDPVDMSNWQLIDGVTYTFPAGTVLGPGEYAVVCEDIPGFNAYYGSPPVAHLGQWFGKLSNNGEPIELINALFQTIQFVRYNDKRPWPISPDGAGPSLERVNPNDDFTSAGYWRAAIANSFSTVWTRYEVTGVATSTSVYFYLDSEGTCLIDDVELRETAAPATNYINNGSFETAAPLQWTATGNHSGSARITTDASTGSACMQITATGAGGLVSGQLVQSAQPLTVNGPQYTLSFWLKGPPPGVLLIGGLRAGAATGWAPTTGQSITNRTIQPGSHTYNAGTDTWRVVGGGTDIEGTTDHFYYAYDTIDGDGSLEATVTRIANTGGDNRTIGGIMIRDTTDYRSPYATINLTWGNGVTFMYRTATGTQAQTVSGPNTGGPVDLRLSRIGDSFVAEANAGAGWVEVDTVDIPMGQTVLIGFVIVPRDGSTPYGETATYDFTGAAGSLPGFFTQVGVPGFMATPGAQNSRLSANVPPYIRNVDTLPDQPTSSDPIEVHAKITDDDGIVSAQLSYQIVSPGNYIRLGDPAYQTNWTNIPMALSTTPSVYLATIPAQPHRTLVRYRIAAQDGGGETTTVPYSTDSEPNYARLVYDGVPDYVAARQPGVTPVVTHSVLEKVPVLHLIAVDADVQEAMAVEITDKVERREFKWRGTLFFNGKVYDHIRFRMRGGTWRYKYQKRMWKFRFNRGHRLDFVYQDGTPYEEELRTLNMMACIQPRGNVPSWVEAFRGDGSQRGEGGFVERASYWLMQRAGVLSPHATWLHFRVIDEASEAGADQYSGDFFGLYLGVQGNDERMLRMNGRPGGNLYKMDTYGQLPGGPPYFQDAVDCVLPANDIDTFISGYSNSPTRQWWNDNLRFDTYYSARAVVDCVHHGDMVGGKNYYYFHDGDTGKWELMPWDFDLTFGTDFGDANKPWRDRLVNNQAAGYEDVRINYRNRLREVIQLQFCEQKFFPQIDEWYDLLREIAEADMHRWDYSPPTGPLDGDQSGHFETLAVRLGDIKEWIRQRVDYLTNPLTQDWWLETGWTWPRMNCWDPDIPATPTLTAPVGGAAFGPNQPISITSTAYSDPNGSPHAASKWIATQIGGNELQPDWTSGETTTDLTSIAIPGGTQPPGQYWLRVKHIDDTGRASWWSEAVTVTISDQASAVQRWRAY